MVAHELPALLYDRVQALTVPNELDVRVSFWPRDLVAPGFWEEVSHQAVSVAGAVRLGSDERFQRRENVDEFDRIVHPPRRRARDAHDQGDVNLLFPQARAVIGHAVLAQ